MSPISPTDMGAAYRSLVLAPGVLASDRLAIDSTRRITVMSYNVRTIGCIIILII
jgi:hypothetical protein